MFYGAYGGFDPWGVGVTPPSAETMAWGVRQAGTTPFGTGLTVPSEPPAILASLGAGGGGAGGLGKGGFGPGLGGSGLGGITTAGAVTTPTDFPSPFGAGGDWAGFTAAGFGAPPLLLPLHGGGAFMNASGMGTGFWISAQNAV